MIALGVYFVFLDFVLLEQILYYRVLRRKIFRRRSVEGNVAVRPVVKTQRRISEDAVAAPSESDPLLFQTREQRQERRRSSAASRRSRRCSEREASNNLSAVMEEKHATGHNFWSGMIWILVVVAAGTMGWFVAYKTGAWQPRSQDLQPGFNSNTIESSSSKLAVAGILGYTSSILYLVARIPQIYHNFTKKSCEGLSIFFFVLSMIGNGTYGLSIPLHSTKPEYLKTNIPWLLGSLGTMLEDAIIFVQFKIYAEKPDDEQLSS